MPDAAAGWILCVYVFWSREYSSLTFMTAHERPSVHSFDAGTIGGTYATPLVNPPEVAIVALGKVRYLPRFAPDGEVEKAALLNISWGADHRVLDGATLAEFSNKWKQYIEQPDRLLLRLT